MKKLLLALCLIFLSQLLFAQINAGPNDTLCPPGTVTLNATTTITTSTTVYNIAQVPYAPDTYTGGTFVAMSDDSQSGPFPIGFSFEFMGVCYTQFYIGSNGWVAFSPQPITFTSAPIPSTLANIPKNCIMGPWQDWHPGIAGGPYINYQTLGTMPNRRLVVSWNNCPMFSCTTTLGTFQIVLYETTNLIQNNLANKPNCLAWAGGTAVQGIHDPTGTIAYPVPGRNSTQWTAINESWTFTPSGPPVIAWLELPANTPVGAGSSIVVSPTTTTSYVATTTGCATFRDTVTVLVGQQVTATPTAITICSGGNVQLIASTNMVTYSWAPAAGLNNTTISNPIASPTTTTNYTVFGTDALGCTSQATVAITVNPTPAAFVTPSAPSYCAGGSVQLNASGGTSYVWSPATGLSSSTISNPTASPTVTTTYTVTVTTGACSSAATVTVTVNPLPTVSAGNNITLCSGGNAQLNGTSNGITFSWSPGGSLSSTTILNPIATPTATTTYTLVATSAAGCTNVSTITVTVNAATVSINPSSVNICIGDTVQLVTSGNGVLFNWTPPSGLSSATSPSPNAFPTTTTAYTVNIIDGSGCTASATTTVTVNPLPNANAGPDVAVCINDSVQLSANGGTAYSWTPTAGLSNPNIASPMASVNTPTTYVVFVSNGTCVDIDTINVSVNAPPVANAGLDQSVCSGGNVQLSASGGVSYLWTPTTGLNNSNIQNPIASPTSTASYVVTVTDVNGCTNTDTVVVTILQGPNVVTSPFTAICPGTTTQLNASGGVTYLWSPSGSLSANNIFNPIASPTATTTYTVIATDSNGCTGTGTVAIQVYPLPNANAGNNQTICNGGNVQLSASGGNAYSWFPSSGLSNPTIANPTASPTATTVYYVVVTDGNGCTNIDSVTVTISQGFVLATASATDQTCGNNDGTATAGNTTGGTAPFTYLWSPGNQTTQTATGLAAGTYTVVVTDANGCSVSQTIVVNQTLGINAAFTTSPSTGVAPLLVNFTNNSTGGGTYSWVFGDGNTSNTQNPSNTYNNPGTYTVVLYVFNSPNCVDSVTAIIVVETEAVIVIPNVFSPNGDGNNDLFLIDYSGVKSAELTIFNRWGNALVTWGNMSAGWDGRTANGNIVVDGTYYYVLVAKDFGDKTIELKGFIQVLTKK